MTELEKLQKRLMPLRIGPVSGYTLADCEADAKRLNETLHRADASRGPMFCTKHGGYGFTAEIDRAHDP